MEVSRSLLNMTNMLFTTTLLLLTLAKCCSSVDPYRTYWYSSYGPTDYGRQIPHEGDNLGKMTMVKCSRFCSDNDKCQAYQFHKTDGNLGTCYTFNSFTYNTIMQHAPGMKYFEKRNCFEVYHYTAAVFYPSISRLILFAGEKTFIFTVETSGSFLTFKGVYVSAHNNFFPGVTGTVDGAFAGQSNSTYIIQGNVVKCYKPLYPNNTVFAQCGPGDAALLSVLDPYFSTNSRLDAILSIDDNNVHVITDNIVHRMTWSDADTKYNIVDSFPRSDTGTRNIWQMAPSDLTAMSRMVTANTYLMIEDYKVSIYNAVSKKVNGILFVCKN